MSYWSHPKTTQPTHHGELKRDRLEINSKFWQNLKYIPTDNACTREELMMVGKKGKVGLVGAATETQVYELVHHKNNTNLELLIWVWQSMTHPLSLCTPQQLYRLPFFDPLVLFATWPMLGTSSESQKPVLQITCMSCGGTYTST